MRKLTDILREEAKEDPRDLRSRSDDRRERREREDFLADLAQRLVDLGSGRWARLQPPELVADAVEDARRIKSPTARKRQMRIVRRHLRDMDYVTLAAQLDALENQRAEHGAQRSATRWADQLLQQGDDGLQAFMTQYPAAERSQLRRLLRACQKAKPEKAKSARSQLVAALKVAVAASAEQPSEGS